MPMGTSKDDARSAIVLRALMEAYRQILKPWRFIAGCTLGIALCLLLPTDLHRHYASLAHADRSLALVTDRYLRFANTAAQIALPVLAKDRAGLIQLVYVGISTTAATHGLKRLVDGWYVRGTRLGERPSGPGSRYNMPSGHSSMASSAAYFVCRRYGLRHALYLIPILLLTMHARVVLDAHTVAAVIAGALTGFIMAAMFTGAGRGTRGGLASEPRLPGSPAPGTGRIGGPAGI